MDDVALVRVSRELRDEVLRLAPRPEQEPFSGRADQTLPAAEADAGRTPYAIVLDGQPVGFFVLDTTPSEADPSADLVLRAFFVDARWQGRGVAGTAVRALAALVRREVPTARSVVLTVNERNPVARRVYLSGGFRDGGERYLGGAAGPQHVLRLDLGNQDGSGAS